MTWLRRPLFGGYGRRIVAAGCLYEVVALLPSSPVPTISELVKRYPVAGAVIVAALVHHWYFEQPITVVVVE